jgi:hypothetical protein
MKKYGLHILEAVFVSLLEISTAHSGYYNTSLSVLRVRELSDQIFAMVFRLKTSELAKKQSFQGVSFDRSCFQYMHTWFQGSTWTTMIYCFKGNILLYRGAT